MSERDAFGLTVLKRAVGTLRFSVNYKWPRFFRGNDRRLSYVVEWRIKPSSVSQKKVRC